MRIKEKKVDIFSLDSVLNFVVVNGLMRFIGFLFRIALFFLGLLFLLITIIVSIIVLFIWITFPVLIIALLLDSFYVLIK